jgi:hypothetical protein
MQNEINKAAEKLGISEEDAQLKFEEICKTNGVETDSTLAKGLWRAYAHQQISMKKRTNNNTERKSFGNTAFGFFVSLEEPRDMMAYNRRKAIEEWKRDAYKAYQDGFVATVEETEDGNYTVSRVFDGEEQTRTLTVLADGAETLDDGTIVIPLDVTKRYTNGGENKNYGKPLAKELMRRSGVFVGKVGDDSDYQMYHFSYKNQNGVDFLPRTFEYIHMPVIKDSNREGYIYGYTKKTLEGWEYNAEMDPEGDNHRETPMTPYQLASSVLADKIVSLSLLDDRHMEQRDLPSVERFVITMGTVCNMNMTPTSNGNRILNITDLNADFDYDTDGMTTCWVPQHIEIDFGIGSEIVVVGRTSMREGDDGMEPSTINMSGLLVTERKGQVVEIADDEEENLDWF